MVFIRRRLVKVHRRGSGARWLPTCKRKWTTTIYAKTSEAVSTSRHCQQYLRSPRVMVLERRCMPFYDALQHYRYRFHHTDIPQIWIIGASSSLRQTSQTTEHRAQAHSIIQWPKRLARKRKKQPAGIEHQRAYAGGGLLVAWRGAPNVPFSRSASYRLAISLAIFSIHARSAMLPPL